MIVAGEVGTMDISTGARENSSISDAVSGCLFFLRRKHRQGESLYKLEILCPSVEKSS